MRRLDGALTVHVHRPAIDLHLGINRTAVWVAQA